MTRRAASSSSRCSVAAALVGAQPLAIPGSPLERRPTLGLDLQGGLEVTLQAVPPRDRELTKADLDRSVEIMYASTASAWRSPRSARRATTDLDPAARRRRPGPRPRTSSARRPSSSCSTSRRTRRAVDRRPDAAAGRDGEALRPSRGPAAARRAAIRSRTTSSRRRGRSSSAAPLDARGGARQVGRQAAEGLQALRRAAQHRGRPVRPRRSGLPGRR